MKNKNSIKRREYQIRWIEKQLKPYENEPKKEPLKKRN